MIGVPERGWLIRSFELGKENLTCLWSDLVKKNTDEHPVLHDKKVLLKKQAQGFQTFPLGQCNVQLRSESQSNCATLMLFCW